MSCNYAENLSHYENKGKLGLPEIFDNEAAVEEKCIKLANLIRQSRYAVVHTGAGISTSAGIPDFRGPNGVWTLEKEGKKPKIDISWDDAKPTLTHLALVALQRTGYISYIITQNVDGLHLRSGIPRKYIAELHGNLFVDKCNACKRQFVRPSASETVGQKASGLFCCGIKANGTKCRGRLHDTLLDWEDSLPDADLELAYMHSCIADLSLCLGTTLQINPSGSLPLQTKKRGGKVAICNLQPTKQDRQADLLIHSYVDDILLKVLKVLEVPLVEYDDNCDPVVQTQKLLQGLGYEELLAEVKAKKAVAQYPKEFHGIDWSIHEEWVKDYELVNKFKNKKVIPNKKLKTEHQNERNLCSVKTESPSCSPNMSKSKICNKSSNDELRNKSSDNNEPMNGSSDTSEGENTSVTKCEVQTVSKNGNFQSHVPQ